MKTAVISGVPLSLQRDSWWMEGRRPHPPDQEPGGLQRDMRKPLLLLALLAFGDAMLWKTVPGLSIAVFALVLVGSAVLMAPTLSQRRALTTLCLTFVAVAPVVEKVQPLSVFLMTLGLTISLCLLTNVSFRSMPLALLRFPALASLQAVHDARSFSKRLSPSSVQLGPLATGWLLPIGLGLVFLSLLVGANPIVTTWTRNIDVPEIGAERIVFWMALLALTLVCLSAPNCSNRITDAPAKTPRRSLPGFVNAPAVTRSLVLFNLLFLVQSGMDLTFLMGTAKLPYGMTYAEYAHRGAYPLLATALLAGAFAVLARPFSDESYLLRAMLVVWLCQTLLLVASSVMRLETYVEAYGLTRLRVAAFIWMGVVGLGLALVLWQVVQRNKTGWLLLRCVGLGLLTLYTCAFVNIDGLIARHNLSNQITRDDYYVCELSEAAVLEIMRKRGTSAEVHCWNRYNTPALSTPADWREWGFRNWRLRRSLSTLQMETTP